MSDPDNDVQLAVLAEKFSASEKKQDERHTENGRKLDAILTQVRLTNGRVDRMEYWKIEHTTVT